MGVLSRVFGCFLSSSKKRKQKGKSTKVSPDEKSGPQYEDEISVDDSVSVGSASAGHDNASISSASEDDAGAVADEAAERASTGIEKVLD